MGLNGVDLAVLELEQWRVLGEGRGCAVRLHPGDGAVEGGLGLGVLSSWSSWGSG